MKENSKFELENVSNDELIEMYSKTKSFIDFLEKESKNIEEKNA